MASKTLQVNFIVATGQQQDIWQFRCRLSPPTILSYKLNMERYTQTLLKMRSSLQTHISYYNTHHSLIRMGMGEGAILLGYFSWKEADQNVQNLFSWLKVWQPLTMLLVVCFQNKNKLWNTAAYKNFICWWAELWWKKLTYEGVVMGIQAGLIHTVYSRLKK